MDGNGLQLDYPDVSCSVKKCVVKVYCEVFIHSKKKEREKEEKKAGEK